METSANHFDKDSRRVKIRKRKLSQNSDLSVTNPKIQKSTPNNSDKKTSGQKIKSKDSDKSEKPVTPEMKTKCGSKVESVNKEKHENKNTMNKDSVQKDKDRKVKGAKEKTKISLETYRKKESEKKGNEESKEEKERKMQASQEKSDIKVTESKT